MMSAYDRKEELLTKRAALHYAGLTAALAKRPCFTHRTPDNKLRLLLTPEQEAEDVALCAELNSITADSEQALIKRVDPRMERQESWDRGVLEFINTQCVRQEGRRIDHFAFANAYKKWANLYASDFKQHTITQAARRVGLTSKPSHGKCYYVGIRFI